MTNTTTLLILAAGMGSRYNGQKQIDTLTESGETLMEFALYDALQSGIKKFVLVINTQFPSDYKKKLIHICADNTSTLHFVEQKREAHIPEPYHAAIAARKKPLGTAHAVLCAKAFIDGPFITMNADDFYGRQTFHMATKQIEKQKINAQNFALVAFELQKTLSPNGSVSRGKCTLKNQTLIRVEEFTKIENEQGRIFGYNEKREKNELVKTTPVSMNFWLLAPSFFNLVESEMVKFLQNHQDLSTVEFYLPSVIDKGIQQNNIEVSVLSTPESWFGLTYPKDRKRVVEAIANQTERGIYPAPLWD